MTIKPSFVLSLALAAVALKPAFAQTITLTTNVKQALDQVTAHEIKADITYLADDKLKGRMPGTEGYQMAVDYVISHLKALNVKPAGENGTWLQTVRLRKAFVNNPALTIAGLNTEAKSFSVYPNPVSPKVALNAPLVFAGFGISEPALGYDDYADTDVKGKVIVVMRGSPDKFASSTSAHVMNTTTILRVAAEHGAVGVILASADSSVKALTPINKGVFSVMDDRGGVVVSRSYYSSQVKVFTTAKYTFLSPLFKSAHQDVAGVLAQLKAGNPTSFAFNNNVSVSYTSTYQDIVSYNVVGKIEGSDPELKNEYVVHSAHLDHLGIGIPVEGDSIYNGAHDNASGVASLLGIAKIYHNIKMKPKRSVLVLMMTGEEMGDLGSGYFAKHPTVPANSMVADVNTDMPTIIAPLLSITALGAEHSSLAKQVDQSAGYLGISVEPDPEPKQARFTRSDQYSFVLVGVPALHVKYGSKTTDGKNNLNDMVALWRAKYYHKPQDDINGIFDFEAGKKYAQLNFLIGYWVAQDDVRPTWNTGDIFAPTLK
jgi:Zn-dependent M28 family amino/carboxypeptidase